MISKSKVWDKRNGEKRNTMDCEGCSLRQEYIEELHELEEKMNKAELFAQKLPVFENIIIHKKLSGESNWVDFGTKYKETPYPWGINRNRFKSGTRREITNFDKPIDYDEYLFELYFNTLSLYDSYEKYDLDELDTNIVYFYDKSNSSFYIKDEHIEEFLNRANEWYLNAVKNEKENRKRLEIKKIEKRLMELKNK